MDAIATTPERAGREGDQQLPVRGKGDILLELAQDLPAELLERRRVGIARYGRPLQAHNGRDACRDLEEEIRDAAAYARQVKHEMRDLREELEAERATRIALEGEVRRLTAERDAALLKNGKGA